ncbi:hypothetical protein [Aeoliella mucimassa]|uniref:PEP-CTERM protein-sorting domain-containing protein n=1 Tax=Aeoliella mucimassa TaxID=2527972 RepID=A0A518AMX7_9BACT|nr:hypothetical protein [Aeoliella mucimassa]QDU56073.1 hypothetical protein Pan181_22760 [Aeoliella mucimassa]
MTRYNLLRAFSVAALIAFCQTSDAGTISIQMSGVDATYDGTNYEDADTNGSDPLDTVTVKLDGANVSGSPFTSDIDLDFFIPNLLNIPAAGGTATSDANGTLDIGLPGSEYVSLSLSAVQVEYVKLSNTASFAFAATVADVAGQSLPGGLQLGDSVEVSFTSILDTLSTDGTYLTSFTASGTGAIKGANVPEPASVVTAGLLGMMLIGGVRRFRR